MPYSIKIKSAIYATLFMFVGILMLGCQKENSENLIQAELHIDAALKPYFERFVTEGNNRGLAIDLTAKRIEGYLINITDANVIGQCTYSENSNRTVNIDSNYWNRATDLEKEFVVFHELGHCYLERSHLDSRRNRTCTSIMHSGTSGCRFVYNASTRSAYLDELF